MDTSGFEGELAALIAGTRREFWSPDNLKIYGDEALADNSCGAAGGSQKSQSGEGGTPSETNRKVPMIKAFSDQTADAIGGRRISQEVDGSEVTSCSSSSGEGSEDRTPMTELDILVQKYDRRLKPLHPPEDQTQSKKRTHITKENSGKYKCEACGKGFEQKSYFNQHVLIHGDERNFSCDICDKSFKQPQALSHHKRTHDSEPSHYACSVCDYSSKWKGKLNQHLKLHSEKAEYKCDRCRKAYKRREALRQHRLVHNFDARFRCEKCDYGFKTKGTLTKHRKVHQEVREYKCEVCSKAFKHSWVLNRHSTIHSNDKLFPCRKCSKTFNRKDALKEHDRTHTGERPYACCDCTKTFSRSSNLNQHRRICPKLDFRVKDLHDEDFYTPKGNLIDTFASTIYPDTDEGNNGFITIDERGAGDAAPGTEDLDGTYTGRVIEVMPSSSCT